MENILDEGLLTNPLDTAGTLPDPTSGLVDIPMDQNVSELKPFTPPDQENLTPFDYIVDAVTAVPAGVVDAVNTTYGFADKLLFDMLPDWEAPKWTERKTGFGNFVKGISGMAFEMSNLGAAGWIMKGVGKLGTVGKYLSVADKSGFLVNRLGIKLATEAVSAEKGLRIGAHTIKGAFADFLLYKDSSENLSNIIQGTPMANPVTEFLSNKIDDSELTRRLKSVGEGALSGAVLDMVIGSVRGLKSLGDKLTGKEPNPRAAYKTLAETSAVFPEPEAATIGDVKRFSPVALRVLPDLAQHTEGLKNSKGSAVLDQYINNTKSAAMDAQLELRGFEDSTPDSLGLNYSNDPLVQREDLVKRLAPYDTHLSRRMQARDKTGGLIIQNTPRTSTSNDFSNDYGRGFGDIASDLFDALSKAQKTTDVLEKNLHLDDANLLLSEAFHTSNGSVRDAKSLLDTLKGYQRIRLGVLVDYLENVAPILNKLDNSASAAMTELGLPLDPAKSLALAYEKNMESFFAFLDVLPEEAIDSVVLQRGALPKGSAGMWVPTRKLIALANDATFPLKVSTISHELLHSLEGSTSKWFSDSFTKEMHVQRKKFIEDLKESLGNDGDTPKKVAAFLETLPEGGWTWQTFKEGVAELGVELDNKAYALVNPSEFFAKSMEDYVLNNTIPEWVHGSGIKNFFLKAGDYIKSLYLSAKIVIKEMLGKSTLEDLQKKYFLDVNLGKAFSDNIDTRGLHFSTRWDQYRHSRTSESVAFSVFDEGSKMGEAAAAIIRSDLSSDFTSRKTVAESRPIIDKSLEAIKEAVDNGKFTPTDYEAIVRPVVSMLNESDKSELQAAYDAGRKAIMTGMPDKIRRAVNQYGPGVSSMVLRDDFGISKEVAEGWQHKLYKFNNLESFIAHSILQNTTDGIPKRIMDHVRAQFDTVKLGLLEKFGPVEADAVMRAAAEGKSIKLEYSVDNVRALNNTQLQPIADILDLGNSNKVLADALDKLYRSNPRASVSDIEKTLDASGINLEEFRGSKGAVRLMRGLEFLYGTGVKNEPWSVSEERATKHFLEMLDPDDPRLVIGHVLGRDAIEDMSKSSLEGRAKMLAARRTLTMLVEPLAAKIKSYNANPKLFSEAQLEQLAGDLLMFKEIQEYVTRWGSEAGRNLNIMKDWDKTSKGVLEFSHKPAVNAYESTPGVTAKEIERGTKEGKPGRTGKSGAQPDQGGTEPQTGGTPQGTAQGTPQGTADGTPQGTPAAIPGASPAAIPGATPAGTQGTAQGTPGASPGVPPSGPISTAAESFIKDIGGIDNLKKLLNNMLGIVNGAPLPGLIKAVKTIDTQNNTVADMVRNYRYNAMLFSPKSWTATTAGNAVMTFLRPFKLGIGGALKGDSQILARAGYEFYELFKNIKDSWRFAKIALGSGSSLTGSIESSVNPFAQRASTMPQGFLSSFLEGMGKVIGFPTNVMESIDEMFGQMSFRSSFVGERFDYHVNAGHDYASALLKAEDDLQTYIKDGQAYSQAGELKRIVKEEMAAGVPEDMAHMLAKKQLKAGFNPGVEKASDRALSISQENTFKTDLPKTGFFQVPYLLQKASANNWIANLVLPFVKTPTNLMFSTFNMIDVFSPTKWLMKHKTYEMEAIAAPEIAATRTRFIRDMASGDPTRRAEAAGRLTIGIGSAIGLIMAANSGLITGAGPHDSKEAQALRASGWQPYSIYNPSTGEYYAYNRFDPIAGLVGLAADFTAYANRHEDPKAAHEDASKFVVAVGIAMAENAKNKSYLTALSDFFEMMGDPEASATHSILGGVAGSFVPTVSQDIAIAKDPYEREVRTWFDFVSKRIPGFRESSLPVMRNVLGEPLDDRKNALQTLWPEPSSQWGGLILPVNYSQVSDDVLDKEFGSLGYGFSPPPGVRAGVDLRVIGIDTGQTAYDRWQELQGTIRIEGKTLRDTLRSLVSSPEYLRASPESVDNINSPRVDMIQRSISRYRAEAFNRVRKEFPEINATMTENYKTKRRLLGVDIGG